jgi:hypothetical protein
MTPSCVGLPEALAKVVSPAFGKRRQVDGAMEKTLVPGIVLHHVISAEW